MIPQIIAGIKAVATWAAENWAAVALASTAVSGYQQYQAREDAKDAAAEAKKARMIEQRRQRVAAIQERQRTLAGLRNAAAQTGTVGSSGVMGAVSSVESQYGANRGAEFAYNKFAKAATSFENQAALKSWRAGQFGTVASWVANKDVRGALASFGAKKSS